MKTPNLLRQGCIALWIAGCASSPTPPPTVRADRAREAQQRRRIDERPGYRARVRLRIASAGGKSSESWTDIVVLDASDQGRRVCEALAERQVAALTGSTLDARLERACGAQPLPEPKLVAGTHLLVDERRLTEVDALVAMGQEPDDAKALGEARGSVTQQTSFDTRADCERMLGRLRAIRKQEEAEVERSVRAFLQRELAREEQEAARACAEETKVKSSCAGAGERDSCHLLLEQARRECQQRRAEVETVRARARSPAKPGPDMATARCIELVRRGDPP